MLGHQQELLKSVKRFYSFYNQDKYPEGNSIFYLNITSSSIGSYILQSLSKNKSSNFFSNLKIIIRDFIYTLKYLNYKIYKPKKNISYNKIIVTWAYKNNFEKNGSLNDRYFNVNSKKFKNCLWFVIYLSDFMPKKIDENIVLLKPMTSKSLNFVELIIILGKNFLYLFKNFKYFLALISNYNYFANIFIKTISQFINKDIKLILMPFEGQPFQSKLVNLIKNKFKNTKTVGYIHAPPLPILSNFVYKDSSPNKIILNGSDQIYYFTKILGWKRSNIKLLPSFRFHKLQNKNKNQNKIYLPLTLRNPDTIFESLKLLDRTNYINLKNFKVQNHPASMNSKKNTSLIKKIENYKLNLNNKKKNKIKKNTSIFIGASGAIIEALERGVIVIQICDDPFFDVYSTKIWPNVKIKKINENIYKYDLKKMGKIIKFGQKKNNFKKILKVL